MNIINFFEKIIYDMNYKVFNLKKNEFISILTFIFILLLVICYNNYIIMCFTIFLIGFLYYYFIWYVPNNNLPTNTIVKEVTNSTKKNSLTNLDNSNNIDIDKDEIKNLIISKLDNVKEELFKDLKHIVESEINNIKNMLNENKGQTNSSYQIGRNGELQVQYFLSKHFPMAQITDVSKINNSGDISFILDKINIMLEIKNKKVNVGTNDQIKFRKDISSNNYHGGILISLLSGIVDHDNFSYETINEKYILYLSNLSECPQNLVAGILFILNCTKNKKPLNYSEKVQNEKIDEIYNQLDKISTNNENLTKLNNHIYDTKNKLNKEFNKKIGEFNTFCVEIINENDVIINDMKKLITEPKNTHIEKDVKLENNVKQESNFKHNNDDETKNNLPYE